MNPDYYRQYEPKPATYNKPNTVKIGGKILYKGKDAADWLSKQKDRNIKATARLAYTG